MKNKILSRLIYFTFAILLTACAPRWEIKLISPEGAPVSISDPDVQFYIDRSKEEVNSIPLGQILYANSYTLIDGISFTIENSTTEIYDWESIASQTIISVDGRINISGKWFKPQSIHIQTAHHIPLSQYSIMDIAPSMTQALGLPELPEGTGVSRFEGTAEHGVMILLDGLQYRKLMDMVDTGKLPFFDQHQANIKMGLTVYPPISTSASAAMLTSAPPLQNGVFGYGYRSTDMTTLFDHAVQAGLKVRAVEGNSLAFNLRNAEVTLSGDRDGNGFSDDNVCQNSLDAIESAMPDLLYIHFHEIDDMGHSFGPDSPQYEQALIRVDGCLANIHTKLPENTLITIFADHGMHTTEEGGNHGTLTPEDMIIPILFIKK